MSHEKPHLDEDPVEPAKTDEQRKKEREKLGEEKEGGGYRGRVGPQSKPIEKVEPEQP